MGKPNIWRRIFALARKLNLFRYIRNLFLCLRYPFLRWRGDPLFPNHPKTNAFSLCRTWLDEIPSGWRKALGIRMSKEILKAGKKKIAESRKIGIKLGWEDLLTWSQIKEKWGQLVLDASCDSEIMWILEKYEAMSICYCEKCGKPARFESKGYISFLCEKCFDKYMAFSGCRHDDSWKEDCRLSLHDLPDCTRFEYVPISFEHYDTWEECKERYDYIMSANKSDPHTDYSVRGNADGTWMLRISEIKKHKVDFLAEYGIDYVAAWGLREEQK